MDKENTVGLPVYYVDRLNYTDIAYILRDLFLANFADTPMTANDEDIDIENLSQYLEFHLQTEGLEDLMSHDFGKGMILGMYLEHLSELARQDEIAALKEMDGEAD